MAVADITSDKTNPRREETAQEGIRVVFGMCV